MRTAAPAQKFFCLLALDGFLLRAYNERADGLRDRFRACPVGEKADTPATRFCQGCAAQAKKILGTLHACGHCKPLKTAPEVAARVGHLIAVFVDGVAVHPLF